MEVEVLTDLADEPISLELAAKYCKVDEPEEEKEILELLITSARQHCEQYTGLSFGPKTYQAKVNRTNWAYKGQLPFGPNIEVVEVRNGNGEIIPADQFNSLYFIEYQRGFTVQNWRVDEFGPYGSEFSFGSDLVIPEEEHTVTYTAGYADGKLPAPIKEAILKTIVESYNNRENTVVGTIVEELPMSARKLLDFYKTKVMF